MKYFNKAFGLLAVSAAFTATLHAQIGSADFATMIKLSTGAGSSPAYCGFHDLDGDGKKDLVVTNNGASYFSIFPGKSFVPGSFDTSMFGARIDITCPTTPTGIQVTDLNKDGKADIVIGHYSTRVVSYYVNTSTAGHFNLTKTEIPFTADNPSTILAEDFDGDQLPDLLVLCFGGYVVLKPNTSAGSTVSFGTDIPLPFDNYTPGSPVAADFDGDGKKDLAISVFQNPVNTVRIYKNTSTTGSISFSFLSSLATGGVLPHRIDAGDLNGDGKADIAVSNVNNNKLSLFQNTSSGVGSISFGSATTIATLGGACGTVIRDLNNDGVNDIAICGLNTTKFRIMINKGSGGSLSEASFYSGVDYETGETQPNNILIDDVDGDTHPDLILTMNLNSKIVLARSSIFHTGIFSPRVNEQVLAASPNPASTFTVLELPGNATQAEISISDIAGKTYGSFTYRQGEPFDVSQFAKGIYLLHVQTNKGNGLVKLVRD